MKFFQSSSSKTQLSEFKYPTGNCLPGVLRCFHSPATHHRIKKPIELHYTAGNPGVVAKLMGLDSIPQRVISSVNHKKDYNSKTLSQPIGQTSMVLELENGKCFVLGFEAGCKGDSKSGSKRKLLEDDGLKKKKFVKETSNANVDHEMDLFDQMVLELVYIF